MDCLLRPGDREEDCAVALAKVPLLAQQRWDGGPFLTYPLRRGLSEMYFGAGGTTEHPWEMRQGVHESQTEDLQTFFQEWLFFGLIIEALDGNTETTSSSHLPVSQQKPEEPTLQGKDVPPESHPAHRAKQTIISRVYQEFVYQVNGKTYITTKSFLAELHDSWTVSLLSLHASRNRLAVRCKRMRLCLQQARYFYTHLPANFRPDIRFSIGAVAETIAHAMQPVCHWLKLDEICPNQWGDGYYQNPEVILRMLNGGWCPSDLVRAVNKFKSLHSLHYLSFVDKKRPAKSHDRCNRSHCLATDLNVTSESRNHWKDGCTCQEVEIDQAQIVGALQADNAVPLLVFKDVERPLQGTRQDTEDNSEEVQLEIEVVSSIGSAPYVAISHIWADGLGNEEANSLNACKLRELRRMVQALPPSAIPTDSAVDDFPLEEHHEECPLVWLDTLCCPVSPDDKKLALKKMRQVYEDASIVLVLDASLLSYTTTSMDTLEVLARIFTSKWLVRVWTLQEGALAKRLWFQFADKALSLADLKTTMEAIWPDNLLQKIIFFDIRYEIDRIEQFFQTKGYDGSGSNLRILDEALLHRGITDPSDEPLCIGTLMDLPAGPILAAGDGILKALGQVEGLGRDERRELQLHLRNLRMKVVWKLLAERRKALPAQMIFFEESRIDASGFRWAPQSLLDAQQVFFNPTLRKLRWDDQKPGILTENGLKVGYPGYRLYLAQYSDGKPRHPWKGRKRPPEEGIVFRDVTTREWYSVATKERAKQLRDESTATTNTSEFPLHDFLHQNSNQQGTMTEVFLLMSEVDRGEIPHSEKNAVEGILTTGSFEELPSTLEWHTSSIIKAKNQYHVIVGPLRDAVSALYNTAETLALSLRAEECTETLLRLSHLKVDEEDYKVALRAVEQRMKDVMAVALDEDEELRTGMRRLWGDDIDEYLWVFVGDWFNHGFLGARLQDDQVWVID